MVGLPGLMMSTTLLFYRLRLQKGEAGPPGGSSDEGRGISSGVGAWPKMQVCKHASLTPQSGAGWSGGGAGFRLTTSGIAC